MQPHKLQIKELKNSPFSLSLSLDMGFLIILIYFAILEWL